MHEVDTLIEGIKSKYPASRQIPIDSNRLNSLESLYPGIPDHLMEFYRKFGYGTIGDGNYSIHFLVTPDDIYDPITAKELDGVLIVGDDFAGNCEAYNTHDNWQFGTIGCDGRFEAFNEIYSNYIEFLTKWFLEEN